MYSSPDEQLFYEIGGVNEQKSIARSARHRVGKSRSRRITLSSDNMTKNELANMNGPVITYNFRNVTFPVLKKFPDNIRYEFFKLMAEKFGATQTALAEELGTSQRNLSYHVSKVGASNLFPIRKMTVEQKNALHEFLCPSDDAAALTEIASTVSASSTLKINDTSPECLEPVEPEIDASPVLPSPATALHPLMMMEEVKLQFTGEFFPQQVYNTLCSLLKPGTKCKINISCELIEE